MSDAPDATGNGFANYFPITDDELFKEPRFRGLSPTTKNYLWWVRSEGNYQRKRFFAADWEPAATLKCSLDTVSRSRRTLCAITAPVADCVGEPWLQVLPGRFQQATTYCNVMGWRPPSEGHHYTRMPRFMWQQVLEHFGVDAAVVYVYLSVWMRRYAKTLKQRGYFTVTLGELKASTGLRNVHSRIHQIQPGFGLGPLFTVTGVRHLRIGEWLIASATDHPEIEAATDAAIQSRAEALRQHHLDTVLERQRTVYKEKRAARKKAKAKLERRKVEHVRKAENANWLKYGEIPREDWDAYDEVLRTRDRN